LPANAVGANSLSDITCPTVGSCVAVGDYRDANLNLDGQIETLADGTWTAIEAPVPGDVPTTGSFGVSFNGVTCPAPGSCVAVGAFNNFAVTPFQTQLFVDSLSDGTWTATDVPLPENASVSYYDSDEWNGLACPVLGSCVAIGQYVDTSGQTDGLVETLSDGTWSASEAPVPPSTATSQDLSLDSIACPGAGSCAAIGEYWTVTDGLEGPGEGVIETLSGGVWTDTVAPVPANASGATVGDLLSLQGVACGAAGSCIVVGDYLDTTGQTDGLIETQSDGTWSAAQAPLSGDASDRPSDLQALSCPAAGSCTAVGSVMPTTTAGRC